MATDRNIITQSDYMETAIKAAKEAYEAGEVPIGAVVVDENGEVLAIASNTTKRDHDPAGHAEILALREAASKLGSARLPECTLYVTLEPCAMCAQAISNARIKALYFGAEDVKGGAVYNGVKLYESKSCFHKPEIYSGLYEQECRALLQDFFEERR